MTTLKKLSKVPTEREMWDRIKKALNTHGRAYRIEAVATPGFPDIVWMAHEGIYLLELKAGKMKFRPQQIRFIKDAYEAGAVVWVIHQQVQRGMVMVYPGIAIIDGDTSDGVTFDNWVRDQPDAKTN